MKGLREALVALESRPRERGDLAPDLATFLRGLGIGALVGAAIAGSLVLGRRREQPASLDKGADAGRAVPRED